MKRLITIVALILAAACSLQVPPQTPAPVPTPTPVIELGPVDTLPIIVRVYVDLLKRQPDPFGIDYYSTRLRSGEMTEATMRAHVMASAEYKALHAPDPPVPPVPALTVRGRQFYDDSGALWVPRMVSGLTLLARTSEQQEAFLSWAAKTGFNGVRVFAGALTWAGQSADGARAALPALLDRAARHGLVVEVTAITDSASGYDTREHVRLLAGLLTHRRGVLVELANEVGHSTQAGHVTAEYLRALGRELVAPLGIVWAVGAASVDEPSPDGVYPTSGGTYATAHLDRGRDPWNQFRRVREIYAIAEVTRAPAINNEPLGCAEPGTPGQRYFDAAMALTIGALDRAFGVGGVHHSQAGLMAELPGPVQQACADAYVAGHRAIDTVLTGQVGAYLNVGHDGSPLTRARFTEGGSGDGVVRAYSFIAGDRGVTILLGAKGDTGLQWGAGWRQVRVLEERTAHDGRSVVVVELARQ